MKTTFNPPPHGYGEQAIESLTPTAQLLETTSSSFRRFLWRMLAIIIGALFVYAGALKAWDPVRFASDTENYHVLPWALNARLAFYGECSAADAARAAARLTPQPLQPVLAPLQLRNAQAARLPRVYVECTQDRAIPIELQRFMATRAAGARLESLPADHSPFLSMPARLLPLL